MARFIQVSQQDNLLSEGMKVLLWRWFYLKFVQKKSTVELMGTCETGITVGKRHHRDPCVFTLIVASPTENQYQSLEPGLYSWSER